MGNGPIRSLAFCGTACRATLLQNKAGLPASPTRFHPPGDMSLGATPRIAAFPHFTTPTIPRPRGFPAAGLSSASQPSSKATTASCGFTPEFNFSIPGRCSRKGIANRLACWRANHETRSR